MLYTFHIMNESIFDIGMFPYMCMALLPIFCKPSWPKHIIRCFPKLLRKCLPSVAEPLVNITCNIDSDSSAVKEKLYKQKSSKCFMTMVKYVFVSFYIVVQLVLPFSHSITKVCLTFFFLN